MYHLSLLYILVAVLATSANALQQQKVARFGLRGTAPTPTSGAALNLTEAEAHARWLMSRKPTRRSTAYRRQESQTPEEGANNFLAIDLDTGILVGNLAFGDKGWTVSATANPSVLTNFVGSLLRRESREAQRLTYAPKDSSESFRYFGVGQCYPGSPTTLAKGSPNVLCLLNSASATRAGALPVKVKNTLDESGASSVETDIWTLDYTKKTATPTWINPDGSAIKAEVVVSVDNPDIVFVTADVKAASERFGLEFRPVALTFKTLSPQ